VNSFIKLGFIGSYKVELLKYFGRFLTDMDKRVVIADASVEQHLFVTLPSKNEEETEFQGISYIANCNTNGKLSKLNQRACEIILVDFGMNINLTEDYKECDILFFVSDFEKHNIMKLLEISEHIEPGSKIVKVYKDIFPSKINKRYIDYILKLEDKGKVLAEYVIEFTERDYQAKLLCQYDDNFSLKYISKEYKNMFSDIAEELFQITTKEVTRKLKRAEGLRV